MDRETPQQEIQRQYVNGGVEGSHNPKTHDLPK